MALVDNLGNQYWVENDYDNTIKYSNILLELAKRQESYYNVTRAYSGLALACGAKGEDYFKQAKNYHELAIESIQGVAISNFVNTRMLYTSFLRNSANEYEKARTVYLQALRFLESQESQEKFYTTRVYHTLAWNMFQLVKYDSAIYYADKLREVVADDPSES